VLLLLLLLLLLLPLLLQERVSLAAGGYVGVRRVVRLLEHGDNAKRIVDAVIDASAQMLNLRVAIMRCVEHELGLVLYLRCVARMLCYACS
jgi:hypothetical protein